MYYNIGNNKKETPRKSSWNLNKINEVFENVYTLSSNNITFTDDLVMGILY